MKTLIISMSISLALTSLFVLQFRIEKSIKQMILYFLAVLTVEYSLEHFFLDPEAFGYEIAIAAFLIAFVCITALVTIVHLEKKHDTTIKDESAT